MAPYAAPLKTSFLSLPSSVRQNIYTNLLAPFPGDDVTTINYTLTWNWLESPSNTTFAGIQQIDLCRCPQQARRTENSPTTDHIYSRYKCYGPEVRFKRGREDLWVPSASYARSGPINFLRPASELELRRRPNANIIRTCKTVYREGVPFLYRRRCFLFLTGPCPRGRYQAYATQIFLSRLSLLARAQVTTLSLIVQPCEEDAMPKDVGPAYQQLATFVQQNLPSFEALCLNLWDNRLADAVRAFQSLFEKKGSVICLAKDPVNGPVVHCADAKSFEGALNDKDDHVQGSDGKDSKAILESTFFMKGDAIVDLREGRKASRRPRMGTGGTSKGPIWEEVEDDDTALSQVPKGEGSARKTEIRTELRLRKVTKVQKVLSKPRDKGKAKIEQAPPEEDDEEWVDAKLSPSTIGSGHDAESWEVI